MAIDTTSAQVSAIQTLPPLVQYARKSEYAFQQILAIEIEPAVINAVRGSTFITPRLRPLFQFIGGLFILLLLLYHDSLSPWENLALLAPVAFVTGSFFPAARAGAG